MDTAIIQYVQGKMAFEMVTTQQRDRWEIAFEGGERDEEQKRKVGKQKVRRSELDEL